MEKEQTPMEELLSIVEELKSKGQEVDTNGLEDWINSVGLGKEKEHIRAKVSEALEEEVIKARVNKDVSIAEKVLHWNVKLIAEKLHMFEADAIKYFDEHVKPKYTK